MQKTNVYRLISLSLLINIIPLKAEQEGLTIVNDTKTEEIVIVRYRLKSGATVTKRLSPGKQFSFVRGSATIRHHNDMYTVVIPRSHPDSLLKLTEIMEAAKQQKTSHGGEGKIGNIKVFFQIIGLKS